MGKRLEKLEENAQVGRFISREDVDELLGAITINEQKTSSGEYLQAFNFFGMTSLVNKPQLIIFLY